MQLQKVSPCRIPMQGPPCEAWAGDPMRAMPLGAGCGLLL